VLEALDVDDARAAYRAIALARPAGLGTVPEHDVASRARIGLREAMALAADRDRIAWQYAHDYADVFDLGLPAFRAALAAASPAPDAPARAMQRVHLEFLAALPDSTHCAKAWTRRGALCHGRSAALARAGARRRGPGRRSGVRRLGRLAQGARAEPWNERGSGRGDRFPRPGPSASVFLPTRAGTERESCPLRAPGARLEHAKLPPETPHMAKIDRMLVGESLVGEGNEVAHIDLIIGPRGSPASRPSRTP
jgi:hypothetical protein